MGRGSCILVTDSILCASRLTKGVIVWVHLNLHVMYIVEMFVSFIHLQALLLRSLSHQDNYT